MWDNLILAVVLIAVLVGVVGLLAVRARGLERAFFLADAWPNDESAQARQQCASAQEGMEEPRVESPSRRAVGDPASCPHVSRLRSRPVLIDGALR